MFDKYGKMGAYHWRECARWSPDYNPPLVARYGMIEKRMRGGRVLDLGAGDGYLSGRLAPRCQHVVALEAEPGGVALARKMLQDHDNVEVMQGDAYRIPFPDGQFDSVAMADVIEHLDEPERALAEAARVLRDDGVALVTTPVWRPDRIWDERHVKEYTADELKSLLASSFRSVEMVFAWPRFWSDLYRTRLGWRALKLVASAGLNPFAVESATSEGFCQMLAIAREPRRAGIGMA